MVTITTTYKVNDKGQGRIVARGNNKQRTMPYDHSLSPEQNHGKAAGILGLTFGWAKEVVDLCQHTNNHDGTHTFRFLF